MTLSPVCHNTRPAGALPEQEAAAFDLLERLGIDYDRVSHDTAFNMELCAEVGRVLDVTVCKNLFLCNRQKTSFYLLCMMPDKPFRTKELSAQINSSRLSFAPEELPQAAAYAKGLAHIRVRGLMTIPPVAVEKGGNIPYFEKVHRLFVDISREMYDNKWEYISMGMSGDYADAVRCGANMVRVGSAIFGARNYQK